MTNFAINIRDIEGTLVGSLDMFKTDELKIEYALSDIRNPDKRKTSFTQEFQIPGSKNNNTILQPFFDNGYSVVKFNPNIKLEAQVSNGSVIFAGSLQLTKVTEVNGNYEYTVIIYDKIVDFFSDLGNDELRGSIDLSEYNHPLDLDTIKDSWTNKIWRNSVKANIGIGRGYVYPLEDRGDTLFNSQTNLPLFNAGKFRPAVFLKEYVDKIFQKTGWSYESKFFNSDYFKKMIIPFSSDKFVSADADTVFNGEAQTGKSNAEFSVKSSVNDTSFLFSTFQTQSALVLASTFKKSLYDETVLDPGNVFSLASDVFTVAKSGNYTLTTGDNYRIKLVFDNLVQVGSWYVKFADGPAGVPFLPYIETRMRNITTGQIMDSTIQHFPVVTDPHFQSTTTLNYYMQSSLSTVQQLYEGHQIVTEVRFVLTPGKKGSGIYKNSRNIFWTSNNRPSSDDQDVFCFTESSNDQTITYMNGTLNDLEVGFGDIVPMNNAIPDKVKLKDLFTSLNKLFNLYWEPTDKFKQLRIEPYEDFFNLNESLAPVQDWTGKVDRSEDYIITPMFELTGNEYVYTYKTDGDWANTKYSLNNPGVFGEKRVSINTDFLVQQEKIEPIFSATPLTNFDYNDGGDPFVTGNLYVPSYTKKDEDGVKSNINPAIRLLFWGGLIKSPNWSIGQPIGSTTGITYDPVEAFTSFPYAGHFDNPHNPTEDLNYGVAQEFYQDWQSVTNNNLFNKYWRNWLNSILDVDAHMLACKVVLNDLDIANFSLKNTYQVDGNFYRVNKMTYTPNTNVANLELIRMFDYPAFKPAIGLFINSNLPTLTPTTDNPWSAGPTLPYIPTRFGWDTEMENFPGWSRPPYQPTGLVTGTPWSRRPSWVGNTIGTWNVGNVEYPVYTGTPWLDLPNFTSAFPATTADFLPVNTNQNKTTQGNTFKRLDILKVNGFYNHISEQIAGPVSINGSFNSVHALVSGVSIMGDNNTVIAGVRSTTVIGNGNYVTESNATYNNGILTKNGVTQQRIDIIRGGIDEVQNPFNLYKIVTKVNGGIDAVKNYNSATSDEIINGSIQIDNKLNSYRS